MSNPAATSARATAMLMAASSALMDALESLHRAEQRAAMLDASMDKLTKHDPYSDEYRPSEWDEQ